MKVSELTGTDNYFEDFNVGDVIRHARGKTVTEMDGVLLCNLVMNTAQGHFNSHLMQNSPFGDVIVFGGIVAAMVTGLAYQDTGEQALAELGLDKVRFRVPVQHGDTLYAFSEVIEKKDMDRDDAGEICFRHRGINQKDELVFEGERRVLVKRRSHWGDR
jgi:itaconyl-CoA hydratase